MRSGRRGERPLPAQGPQQAVDDGDAVPGPEVRDQQAPQQRLPVVPLALAPTADYLRAEELIAVERIRDAAGQLPTFETLRVVPQVAAERVAARLRQHPGEEGEDLPGHDIGVQGVPLGQVIQKRVGQLPHEGGRQGIGDIRRYTVGPARAAG